MRPALEEKIKKSIHRFQAFEPEDGYYIAFSGGKDSCVVKALADMAGVKYDAHYNVTSVDPPELIRFIREMHPDVIWDYPRYDDGSRITMWNLIAKKGAPPQRTRRYCCKYLKEKSGRGRFNVTGVRWAESLRRRNTRGGIEINFCETTPNEIYDVDNEEERLVRLCRQNIKRILNPIIDWEDQDVWDFIREYKIPYCELYDKGKDRIGCIACPMAGQDGQRLDFEQYPKYKTAYLKAFDRMVEERKRKGKETIWENGEDVMRWWIGNEDDYTGRKKFAYERKRRRRQARNMVQRT